MPSPHWNLVPPHRQIPAYGPDKKVKQLYLTKPAPKADWQYAFVKIKIRSTQKKQLKKNAVKIRGKYRDKNIERDDGEQQN